MDDSYNFFELLELHPDATREEIENGISEKERQWLPDLMANAENRIYRPMLPEIRKVMLGNSDPDRFEWMRDQLTLKLKDLESAKIVGIRSRTNDEDVIFLADLTGLQDKEFSLDRLKRLASDNGISVGSSDTISGEGNFKLIHANLDRLSDPKKDLYEFLDMPRHAETGDLEQKAKDLRQHYDESGHTAQRNIAAQARSTFQDEATRISYGRWLDKKSTDDRERDIIESARRIAPDKNLRLLALRNILAYKGYPLDLDPKRVEQRLREHGYSLEADFSCKNCDSANRWFAVACKNCGKWFDFKGEKSVKCPSRHENPFLSRYCCATDKALDCGKKIKYASPV